MERDDRDQSNCNRPESAPLDDLDRWRQRLQSNPRSTIQVLKVALGRQRTANPRIESLFWQTLMESCPSEELARTLLQRLDLDSECFLLDLSPEERDLLHEHFQSRTRRHFEEPDLEMEGHQEVRLPSLLEEEEVLKTKGGVASTGALCALAHDRLKGRDDPSARFKKALLRFQLSHALFLLEDRNRENVKTCIRFARRTVEAVDRLFGSPSLPKKFLYRLTFLLQSWIGHRCEWLGDFESAARAYSTASIYADTTEDRFAYTVRTAATMTKSGHKGQAYELLRLVKSDFGAIKDGQSRRLWEVSCRNLRRELRGGIEVPPSDKEGEDIDAATVFNKEMNEVLDAWLDEEGMTRGQIESGALSEEELDEMSSQDVVERYQLLSQMALLRIAEKKVREADALMEQAEKLESRFEDRLPKLERRILLARLHLRRGETSQALGLFASLYPLAGDLLSPDRLLALVGHYLEALSADQGVLDVALIEALVGRTSSLLDQLLARQYSSAARHRLVRSRQRPLESALAALLSGVEKTGTHTPSSQAMLSKAWGLIMSARNPELRTRTPLQPDETAVLRELEDSFHRLLRWNLIEKQEADWQAALAEIIDFEISKQRGVMPSTKRGQSRESIEIALFQFRELFKDPPLLILSWRKGRFDFRFVSGNRDPLWPRLVRWSQMLTDGKISRESGSIQSPPILELLPSSYSLLTSRRLPKLKENGPRERTEPMLPESWNLYPDGHLPTLPMEMMRDSQSSSTLFGQNRSVRHCLRSFSASDSPVDFSRGWIGLSGGGPIVSRALSGGQEELIPLYERIRLDGYPARLLSDEGGCVPKLESELAEMQPSTLHIACEAFVNPHHPEACALWLADCPGRAERELFPFRHIRRTDLTSLDLVILSLYAIHIAVPGSIGGIEELVMAFLQAGTTQVIANRYPVDRASTTRLMKVLYRHLLDSSVAEALGRTRDACLREHRIGLREVGAWSVWC